MDEVLILLAASGPLGARELASSEPVAGAAPQVYGERVVVARLGDEQQAAVSGLDGVAGIYTGAVPAGADLPEDLTGRLAVAAWNARRAAAASPVARIGDGVAWDDPRFDREGRPGSDAG